MGTCRNRKPRRSSICPQISKLKSVNHIGIEKSGNWIATTSSVAGTALTDKLTLEPGTWVVIGNIPSCQHNVAIAMNIDDEAMVIQTVPAGDYGGSICWIFSSSVEQIAWLGAGSSGLVNYANTKWGGIRAVRIR